MSVAEGKAYTLWVCDSCNWSCKYDIAVIKSTMRCPGCGEFPLPHINEGPFNERRKLRVIVESYGVRSQIITTEDAFGLMGMMVGEMHVRNARLSVKNGKKVKL
jgi:hypothetical protein